MRDLDLEFREKKDTASKVEGAAHQAEPPAVAEMTVVGKTGEEAEEMEEEDLAGQKALRVIAAVNPDMW